MANRKATAAAGIAIQEAARNKAKVQADTARRNIDNMTLKAKSTGYVSVQQNTGRRHHVLGHVAAAVPGGRYGARRHGAWRRFRTCKNWEVTARIGELDRGHLAAGPEGRDRGGRRCPAARLSRAR